MRTLARLALVVVGLSLLPACTYIKRQDAHQVEATLAAAGFKMKPADTPERLAKLQAMPVRKIFTEPRDGETAYLYADAEFCKCLYVGRQEQYDRYQRLAIERQLTQERVEAAEMNENAAMDWGLWGPFW
ncbi:hypothetical protein KF840_14360 [bacterium]|nr:hypothetical protein [bacterium]